MSQTQTLGDVSSRLLPLLRSLLESIDEVLIVTDRHLSVLAFNDVAQNTFSRLHHKALYVGAPYCELLAPADRASMQLLFEAALRSERVELLRHHELSDGRRFAYQLIMRPLIHEGVIEGAILHARDVTSQMRAEEALRESNERFTKVADTSYDMIWEANLLSGMMYYSEHHSNWLGYEKNEIRTRQDFFDIMLHPDDRTWMYDVTERALASADTVVEYPVHRLLRTDGSFVYGEARAYITRDASGRALLLTGTTHDVTQRRLNELALQELNTELRLRAEELQVSIERYDLVARVTSDVVWEWNALTNSAWYGPNMEELFGHRLTKPGPDEWISRVHPDDRNHVLASVSDGVEVRAQRIESEYRYLRADGSWAWVSDRAYAEYDGQGSLMRLIGSMQDITRLKELQQQIHDEQVSLQRLVAEAAIRSQEEERAFLGRELHDNINQLLASCKLMSEMAIREPSTREFVLPRTLSQLNMAIDEIRRLSRQLTSPTIGEQNLEEALSDLIDTIGRSEPAHHRLQIAGQPFAIGQKSSLMLYRVVQEQLQNVQRHSGATQVVVTLEYQPGAVRLEVADDGCGFDPGAQKPGTGLRNARTRVELFNGTLDIDTAPGKGCRLCVVVPSDTVPAPAEATDVLV